MTAKIQRHFEIAVSLYLHSRSSVPLEHTPQVVALLNLAGEVDGVARQLLEDVRGLAVQCTRYADSLDVGGWSASPPTDSSTVLDVARRRVQFNEKREALFILLAVLYGDLARGCVMEHLDESYAVIRNARLAAIAATRTAVAS